MRRIPSPFAVLFAVVLALSACQPTAPRTSASAGVDMSPTSGLAASPLAGARQLILVVSDDFSSNQARLRRFERPGDGRWRPVGDDVAVTLGKNGMAWGRGVSGDPPASGPVKVEGDGRSPAGVFTFSTAFAYQPGELWKPAKMPMHRITDQTVCVETITSASYNRIVEENTVADKDWENPDHMLRSDDLYRYGLFVNHNAPNIKSGAGSCIFMHLWRRPGAPTAGCTAMNESSMLVILAWIDAGKNPVLMQLPRKELQRLAPAWGAPELAAAAKTMGRDD